MTIIFAAALTSRCIDTQKKKKKEGKKKEEKKNRIYTVLSQQSRRVAIVVKIFSTRWHRTLKKATTLRETMGVSDVTLSRTKSRTQRKVTNSSTTFAIYSPCSNHTAKDFVDLRSFFFFAFKLFSTYFSGEHIWYSKQRHRGQRDFHRIAKDVPYRA